MTFNIVAHRKIWFILSGLLVLGSFLALLTFGLKYSIDFTGGSLLELGTSQPIEISTIRTTLADAGYTNISLQTSGETGFLLRTEDLTEEEHQALLSTIRTSFTDIEELRFDSIGPVIGDELRRTAIMGVILTLLLIGLYIAWSFRKVSEPIASWKYGALTILTAFHDVIIPLGAFAVLGRFFGWEVGTAFVAAILTILGYSINDTVVVFDRTRENLLKRTGSDFEQTVELSIKQTLTRSLNTSFTTMLALLAIFLFGGETTKPFAMALIIGIAAGAYSSIFFASPLLVTWEKWVTKR
jgi:preprotein translocase subunit SecF